MRAVLYARCSTEEESQKNALVKQVEEAKACIHQNEWTLVDSYVESASGTTTKGRSEYNRLYEDLLKDRFDILVIKSQDRLMRSTKDWYLFLERLNSSGKRLYIYIEQKFYTSEDSLITGIKAILAEEYSRELSKKINNAHRNRQKTGGTVVLTPHAYGFRKLPDKSIALIEEEAEIKRKMYQLCAAGFGARSIENILKKEGITNRRGTSFTATDILRIIRNPLNKGTVVMNRRHYDFETKKVMRNPEEELFIYEHKVPETVPEELWEQANRQVSSRTLGRAKRGKRTVGKNAGQSSLSGKICCGLCGNLYYRDARRRYKNKNEIIREWKCRTYLEAGRNIGKYDRPQLRKITMEQVEGCDNVHLPEEKLYDLLEKNGVKAYQVDKEKIMKKMVHLLKTVLEERNLQPDIERLMRQKAQAESQMGRLVDKLLDGTLSDEVYKAKQRELEQQKGYLQGQIEKLENQKAQETVLSGRIQQIEASMQNGQIVEKATVDEMLDEVSRIVIYPTYMEIYFSVADMVGIEIPAVIDDGKLRIDYGNLFNYREQKREEREAVVEMMRENPGITAKMIAKELNCSLSGANYKIKALKKEGRIRFMGKGGIGHWEVMGE